MKPATDLRAALEGFAVRYAAQRVRDMVDWIASGEPLDAEVAAISHLDAVWFHLATITDNDALPRSTMRKSRPAVPTSRSGTTTKAAIRGWNVSSLSATNQFTVSPETERELETGNSQRCTSNSCFL